MLLLAAGPLQNAGSVAIHRSFADEVDGFWSAKAGYVEYRQAGAVQTLAGKQNFAFVQREFDTFVRQAKTAFKDGELPTAPYSLELDTEVCYSSSKLVSLLVSSYSYTGGAHGNHLARPANFGLVNGKAKRLNLSDVLATKDVVGTVSKLIMPQIMEAKRKFGETEKPTFNREVVERWTVTPKGMTWVFENYLIGSYAEGEYTASLTWKQLRPHLKKSGPLSSLSK